MTNPKKSSLVAESAETTKIKQDEIVSTKDGLIKLVSKSEAPNTATVKTTDPKPITTTKDKVGDVRPSDEEETNSKKKS